jgi:hypothetical protein
MTITSNGWERGLIPQSIVIEFFGNDNKYIVWGVALHDAEKPFWIDRRLSEEPNPEEAASSYESYATFAEILVRVLEFTGLSAEEYSEQCEYKNHKLYNGLLEVANSD